MKLNESFIPITLLFAFGALFGGHAWSATPEVKLASGPLYGGRGNVHPNMVLSLSVEFPTVGVAYRGDGGTYNKVFEYVGYFNPLKCYVYNGGERNIVDGFFSISKSADPTTHECGGDSFSGNFMNWAGSSSIDMLRYALTGGDRVVDSADTTVLQRAVLREQFYASDIYFPRRTVTEGVSVSAPNQVTPFAVKTLYVVSCRNRILFSDTRNGGNCDTPAKDENGRLLETDKKLGEYLVRVRVCDGADASTRAGLCQKIGNNYKPVGEMQKHSDKIRFAAMGYLLDDSAKRYGGVLRAPMKYVGAKKFEAPEFGETANDRREWDASTGVFYRNPEDSSDRNGVSGNSGVINYLNKFGRSGNYKALDPIGELYYEGLRYLQGKAPTPESTAAMTEPMKDGFPVVTTWKDPVTASCQKNYMVTIADVNTHWDRYIPGNDRSTYGKGSDANDPARLLEAASGKFPELDVKSWTKLVGEMEADKGGSYTNTAPRPGLASLESLDTGSGGHGTYYMAGLAYWANTHDIRLDKPVRVKTFAIDVDEGGNGMIDGNSRGLKPRDSQLYLAAKYGGFEDRNGDGNPFVTIEESSKAVVKGSNLEWDNGAGVPATYFLAGQPNQLISSIRKIFSDIASSSGTMSGASVSSTKISSGGGFAFEPGFEASKWSGSLKKRKLTFDETGLTVQLAELADWDAGEVLTGKGAKAANPAPETRSIYSAVRDAGKSLTTVAFRWDQLGADQQALLNASPVDGKDDGLGEKRVNFLRGDRSLELGQSGGIFRARDRVLGDIINGNPTYVGAPASNVQGPDYQKFYDDNKGRTAVVYVGANDGMLHAFGAADGKELFAYVPNAIIPGLAQLTVPDYVHRPYVDGVINVSEARIGSAWKTILASGMGGGAQGVFALDVTNPSSFGGGMRMIFEFNDTDDPDIGNLTGAPSIAKFKTSTNKGIPEYKYFVVVPSGFNNYKDDGADRFNATVPGVLFLLSIDKPAGQKWTEGVNYYKFSVPTKDAATQNALSAPAFAVGSDGAVRYAYAGDLQGNLWRFNFTGPAPWSNALGATSGEPLFTARDGINNRQPITVQPKVVFAPGGGYLILFGTGKFVEDADAAAANYRTQSLYGIYDSTQEADTVSGRAQLAGRNFKKTTTDGGDALTISGDAFVYGASGKSRKGWYFDFLESEKTGERSVTNPLLAYGRLFVNSLIPGNDPCASGGGRTYVLDALSGLAPGGGTTGLLSQVGMLSSPVLLETGAAAVGDRNSIGKRVVKKKYTVFNFGTGGAKGTTAVSPEDKGEADLPAGRFSWREILNWQELRDAIANK